MEEEGDRLDMALLFPSLLVPSPFLPQGMLEEPGAPGRAEELEQASVTGVCGQQLESQSRGIRYKSHRNLGNNQKTEGPKGEVGVREPLGLISKIKLGPQSELRLFSVRTKGMARPS